MYNQIDYTIKCIESINRDKLDKEIQLDLIVVDDCSDVDKDKLSILEKYNLKVIKKTIGKGVTDSWNILYKEFIVRNYDFLFISNNDVIIPTNSINNMVKCLDNCALICPLTTKYGAGAMAQYQDICLYYPEFKNINSDSTEKIQSNLSQRIQKQIEVPIFNGFFFGVSKAIIRAQFDNHTLFNPNKYNVGNESDLTSRIISKNLNINLALNAFIFHFKNITFNFKEKNEDRNNLSKYRLTQTSNTIDLIKTQESEINNLEKIFDWVFYVNNYPDLQRAGINTKEKAIQHYIKYGKKEGRQTQPTLQNKPSQKYYLSICAIVKDEGPYLKEWIEFHKLVGVEHFYIYDNNSTDNTKQILQPYITQGLVTNIYWQMHPGQTQAYNHCLKNYGKDSKWIAFIDLDEFLFGTKKDNLKDILNEYENYSGIGINWVCFGSNNIEKKTNELVIKRFTKRAFLNFLPNKHIKSIVQPSLTECAGNTPHQFIYKNNSLAVDENFKFIQKNESLLKNISINKIRINHYLVKSKEECLEKINRGRATIKDNRKEDYFEKHNKNDEEDITILRFLPNLKKALEFNPVIFLPKKSHILKKSVEIFKNKLFLIKKSINLNKTPFYFDWNFYVNNYYDLQLAKINTKEKAVNHWIKYGKKEGRICSPIFAKKNTPKKENEIRG